MALLKKLETVGQSVWLDFIDRKLMETGKLSHLIETDHISGLTSNPAVFEKAIVETSEYDDAIEKLLFQEDREAYSVYEELAIQDIQKAADVFYPLYQKSDGRDGFVSLEVSPYLAKDTAGTISEARRLWASVDRPNLLVKVPATEEGIVAIRQLIEEGLSINVTLIFSVEVYKKVAEAFMAGLEARVRRGEGVSKIASVASFFLSRIDSAVDKKIQSKIDAIPAEDSPPELRVLQGLLGKVAVASAKAAYEVYINNFSTPRWEKLSELDARPQRLLWASTGTKNPRYSDVKYMEELIGPETVTTVPPETLNAFIDHGTVTESLTQGFEESERVLEDLSTMGINLQEVTDFLTVEGIEKFSSPFDRLLESLERKRSERLSTELNRFSYKLPVELQADLKDVVEEWRKAGKVRSEWKRDSSIWTLSGEEKWLGWLGIPSDELKRAEELMAFAREIQGEGIVHAVLLGMGGSSLGAEVLNETFGRDGVIRGYPKFHILDSTDPSQIYALEKKIDLAHTIFLVSSKSGSTLEPNIFFEYFYAKMKLQLNDRNVGSRFIAITDPGTSLEVRAHILGFRKIFSGIPSIGGRYSILSHFGMVPGALMGMDVKRFLEQTLYMVRSCSKDVPPSANLGVLLGLLLGVAGKNGYDKITFVCSKEVADLGAWLEQLLAESTGKQGKGFIPIDREPLSEPSSYGKDRLFVHLYVESADEDFKVRSLEIAGHPVIKIQIADIYNLGQEFFRWEMATSVAGAVLGINPFDQPDVEESKVATRKLTQEFEEKGAFPAERPFFQEGDIQLFDDPDNEAEITKSLGDTVSSPLNISDYLRAHLDRIHSGDYFAILAYVPMNEEDERVLQSIRSQIMSSKKVATCVEFGPRFLHSTGQAYKGGPNSGVFLQITCDDPLDLDVPGHNYSFGVVKAAEAKGDFDVLTHRHRRALRIHLRNNPSLGLEILSREIAKAVA